MLIRPDTDALNGAGQDNPCTIVEHVSYALGLPRWNRKFVEARSARDYSDIALNLWKVLSEGGDE